MQIDTSRRCLRPFEGISARRRRGRAGPGPGSWEHARGLCRPPSRPGAPDEPEAGIRAVKRHRVYHCMPASPPDLQNQSRSTHANLQAAWQLHQSQRELAVPLTPPSPWYILACVPPGVPDSSGAQSIERGSGQY